MSLHLQRIQSSGLFSLYTFISFPTLFNEVGEELVDTSLTGSFHFCFSSAISFNFEGIKKKYIFSSVAREVKREKWLLLLYSVARKLAFILQDGEVCLFLWNIPSSLNLKTRCLSYFKAVISAVGSLFQYFHGSFVWGVLAEAELVGRESCMKQVVSRTQRRVFSPVWFQEQLNFVLCSYIGVEKIVL